MKFLDLDTILDNDRVPIRRGAVAPVVPGLTVDASPTEWRVFYRERCAIMQLSGGLTRAEAEREAIGYTINVAKTWHLYPTY